MLTAVALVGLPHGAYDLEVGRRLFSKRLGPAWWAWFGGAYVLLAVAGTGLWLAAPLASLALLLVGGSVHWGVDDLEEVHSTSRLRTVTRLWLGASRGAVPVAAPMLLCAGEVAIVFETLLGGRVVDTGTVSMLGAGWLVLAGPGLIFGAMHAFRAGRPHGLRSIGEPVVLLALFAATSAMLGFVIYFCFWHSVRHSIRSACGAGDSCRSASDTIRAYVRAVWLPTMLTWAAAGAAFFLALGSVGGGFEQRVWSVVFIGLFALTIPHVLLELLEHRESRGDESA
ncbi:MAG: Brp/Blh family beta-carotene 15,15'-dioxygenase [Planctomycetota bacterium]